MSTLRSIKAEDAAMRHWMQATTSAAVPFEGRWSLNALNRVNPDIHRRLVEQRSLFDQAVVTGSAAEIETHGAALCRGYHIAAETMQAAAEPDDAYLIGQDPRSGLKVAVSQIKAAAERARQLHGKGTLWVTPDEVAILLANAEQLRITIVKQHFPGAEIVDVRKT
jgi:hypothetical protein